MFPGSLATRSVRHLVLPLLVIAGNAAAAHADEVWLECAVTHAVVHSDGSSDSSFSMKMIYVYDSDGKAWSYYPSNQRLNPIAGAHMEGGKLAWTPPAMGQAENDPTTIDLNSGEYRASGSVHTSAGETVTQSETGLCQATAARSVIAN